MKKAIVGAVVLGAALAGAGGAAGAETNAAAKAQMVPPKPEAVQRWQDLRFGMFIHWGPVSLTGHEIGWSRGAQTPIDVYDSLYKQFNPSNFNADAWVRTAKDAGMKYMVLTTKHHDGFCLFDTKYTDYNIMHTPFGRDVVKELSDACKKQGMIFGTYYSVTDWYDPNWPVGSPGGKSKHAKPDLDAYQKYLNGQIEELITKYGPLLTIWNDVPSMYGARGLETIRRARALQPDILLNNRTGAGGDYDTPEQHIGGFNMERPWETCMTICHQWSWKPGDAMKSLEQCLQTLVMAAGGNGNLLFNVGPMPDGRIEPRQVARLKEMGEWLQKYGESVYGTRGGPYKPGKWGAATRKGKTVFVHVFKWDGDAVRLPALPAKVLSARALGGGEAVAKQDEGGLTLSVPADKRDPIDTVIALELDRPAMELAPIAVVVAGGSLTSGAKATASNVFQKGRPYGPEKAVDDDADTRWATDAGTKQAWLQVELGKPTEFSKVGIREWEGDPERIRKFEVQVKDGEVWKTILEGTKAGADFKKEFPAVTASVVRLNILDASEGPTIEEFQLWK